MSALTDAAAPAAPRRDLVALLRRRWTRPLAATREAQGPTLLRPREGAVLVVLGLFGLAIAFDPLGQAAVAGWSAGTLHLFRAITTLGDSGLYLVPLGLALVALALYPAPTRGLRGRIAVLWLQLAFAFTAIAGTGLAANIVKRMIGRMRPMHLGDGDVWQFTPFAWRASAASLPSGHATTAFCVLAVVLLLAEGQRARIARALLLAAAVLVCVSRVVIGAHFVSDAVAGAAFGGLATLAFARFLARRRLVFRRRSDGSLALRGALAPKTARALLPARRGA